MRLRLFIEPQLGASYFDVLRFARAAETLGFEGLFCSDHYVNTGDGSGAPGPCDAWTTIAGLARETDHIRLGTLMSSATFRRPGPLAIAVAQVDLMSGGRVELGLGAGWYEAEHRAYGIPLPPVTTRFERLEEQLQIVIGLWKTPLGETFSFRGKHYELVESPGLPKPVQKPYPPILIGGRGSKITPRLAARFASEYNVPMWGLEATLEQFKRVGRACEEVGRDPTSIVWSAAQTLCVGETEREVAQRAANIGQPLEVLRSEGLAGTVEEVVDKISFFGEIGARRLYLHILDIFDSDYLALIAERVLSVVHDD